MSRIESSSTITAVTVYRDRAAVTRSAAMTLDAGVTEIAVGGLPATLDEYTFRVGGRGAAAVKIAGVELVREYRGVPLDAERRELRDALTAARDRRASLDSRRTLVAERIDYLRRAAKLGCDDLSKTMARKRLTVDEGRAIMDFYHDGIAGLTHELEGLTAPLRAADEEIAALEQRWQQLESPRILEGKSALVRITVATPGDFTLELSYAIAGASWQSTYDLRLAAAAKKLRITYKAAVMQQTGESWDGVALTLSTASPGAGANPPELAPGSIDVFRPLHPPGMPSPAPQAPRAAAASEKMMAALDEDMVVAEEEPREAEMASAAVQSAGGPSVTYRAPGAAVIPPDGNPHLVLIGEEEFGCDLDYGLVPELAQTAYLRAKARNDSALVLLPGATNIYRDDDFVGRGALDLVNPGAEVSCYLGSDERLRVSYDAWRVDDDSAGLTGGLRRLARGATMTVASDLPETASLRITARVPVSRNKDIKVKSVKFSHKPAEERDNGLVRFDLALPARAKLVVEIDYTVEFPREMTVTGV